MEELEELRTKWTWEKTTLNGISVRKITGPNGNPRSWMMEWKEPFLRKLDP